MGDLGKNLRVEGRLLDRCALLLGGFSFDFPRRCTFQAPGMEIRDNGVERRSNASPSLERDFVID